VRTVILSDLHLASSGAVDLLRRADMREALWAELEGVDEVVLLGDVIELRDRPLADALQLAAPFFEELGSVMAGQRVVIVPGNHDHHVLEEWLEERRLDQAEPLGLEQRIAPDSGPLSGLTARMGGAEVELAYPGVWLREDVYAMHGHYLDRHLTVPTFERLAVAAVERLLGGGREASVEEPRDGGEAGSVTPDDYERAQEPVYAFLFALAQAGVGAESVAGANPSARLWQALGGGYGRTARLRGWVLGTVAVPGAVGVANRLGLGPVRSDLSPGAITRAGLAAIAEVAHRLRIEADHLIFGHTHRRGPMANEAGWRLENGMRLWNSGSWAYAPGLVGRRAADSPYWPGTIVVLEGDRQPRPRQLLDDLTKADLRGDRG
jgi:predicted phosphodiesterase